MCTRVTEQPTLDIINSLPNKKSCSDNISNNSSKKIKHIILKLNTHQPVIDIWYFPDK